MGAGEEGTAGMPTKSSKSASSAHETPSTPTTAACPDLSSSMQAFYGAGAMPPFFASTVATPIPHSFLWGSQHPLMPPYGTPVPYPVLYHPMGVYAQPNMVLSPSNVKRTAELEGKATVTCEVRASSKTTKSSSGNCSLSGGKTGDGGKTASGSGNDIGTQSAETGSEGSSDANDDDKQEYLVNKKGSFDQKLADANLNIGMDSWNASTAGAGSRKSCQNPSGVSLVVASSGAMNDQSIQDERELKRQRRKLSNRESARRSRLRKQVECKKLHHRVGTLGNGNLALREELQRLSEECQRLTSENNSMKGELSEKCGADIVSKLEVPNLAATHLQLGGNHGN